MTNRLLAPVCETGKGGFDPHCSPQLCGGRLQEGPLVLSQDNAGSNPVRHSSSCFVNRLCANITICLWADSLMGERLPCKQLGEGSNPFWSTKYVVRRQRLCSVSSVVERWCYIPSVGSSNLSPSTKLRVAVLVGIRSRL